MEWRKVKDFPYEINIHGDVRRAGKLCCMKPQLDGYGYYKITLRDKGMVRQVNIHRLVCETFHGDPLPGMEVLHTDGDKKNNHASNLRWGTRSQNRLDSINHNTLASGERHPSSLLTDEKVRQIKKMHMETKSLKKVAEEFGISRVHVHNIVKQKVWKHVK